MTSRLAVSLAFADEPLIESAAAFYEPLAVKDVRGRTRNYPSIATKIWAQVDTSAGFDGCWPWRLGTTAQGYGQISSRSVTYLVHRVVYEMLVGPIPEGHQLDHLCHFRSTSCKGGPTCPHRKCANPFDLEPVTPMENVRRGAALITQCRQGHEYTPENTEFTSQGHRRCRKCHTAGTQARYVPKGRKVSPEVLTRIFMLRGEGLSTARIGENVGLSQSYVVRLLNRHQPNAQITSI